MPNLFGGRGSAPEIYWAESDQGAGNQLWNAAVNNKQLKFSVLNDAGTSLTTWLTVTRTNDLNISSVEFNSSVPVAGTFTGDGSGLDYATANKAGVVKVGPGLEIANGVLSAAAGSGLGSVTSVALSLPNIFTVSGSPVTTNGTLAASLANQSANLLFAGPSSGAAAAPSFRALVVEDIPELSTSKLTSGTLSVARGGTGQSTLGGTNRLLYTPTTDNISSIATANNAVLVTDASGVPTLSDTLPAGIKSPAGQSLASKYATVIGDGVATEFTITHNLGTRDVVVTVYSTVDYFAVIPDVEHATINTVILYFSPEFTPTVGEYRVVVVA